MQAVIPTVIPIGSGVSVANWLLSRDVVTMPVGQGILQCVDCVELLAGAGGRTSLEHSH